LQKTFSHPPSPIWAQDKEHFLPSHTPYEYLSNIKFENEIENPPLNAQEESSLATDDEKPHEHRQQEELVEEINLKKNDEKYFHYIKEESFQYIVDDSRTLELVGDKEKKYSYIGKTIAFLNDQELISLNHGSKALLVKQCNHILNALGSICIQYILSVPMNHWYKPQHGQ
jgi:hypothetical protein